MTNLELMQIVKNVGINHYQKQWLHYLGGVIVIGTVYTFILNKHNKSLKDSISAAMAENNKICMQVDNNKSIISKLQNKITDLENAAQNFKHIILTLQNNQNINPLKA